MRRMHACMLTVEIGQLHLWSRSGYRWWLHVAVTWWLQVVVTRGGWWLHLEPVETLAAERLGVGEGEQAAREVVAKVLPYGARVRRMHACMQGRMQSRSTACSGNAQGEVR